MTSSEGSAERTYLSRTFHALAEGFQFSSTPPEDIGSNRYYFSDDPWEILGSALARLQAGDFDAVEALPRVMSMSDDALVWNGASQLLGFACPWSNLQPTAQRLIADRHTSLVQFYAPEMLQASMAPWAIELLLDLHDAVFPKDTEDRGPLVQGCLSRLLEPQADVIDDGPEEIRVYDPDYPEDFEEFVVTYRVKEYADFVLAQKRGLVTRLGSEQLAIAEGSIFAVSTTAERLLHRLQSEPGPSGRLEFERMRLEAATGLDCGRFYSGDWRLQKLQAMAVVEDFIESGKAAGFRAGTRYFFGHQIPD